MTLLLYTPVYYLFGIPIFAYLGVIVLACIIYTFYWLWKQTVRDLHEAMTKDYNIDIKHINLN